MIVDLGCTGDRITQSGILERIVNIEHKTIELCGVKMMYCGIALKTEDHTRPFVVTGEPSVCIDPDNWREEIGKKISFDNAFAKIWSLEAYRFVTKPKPPARETPVRDGFKLFESKPVEREAYQLTKRDIITMTWAKDDANNSNVACVQIEGHMVEFAFHCHPDEIKAGDYVVFLNEKDTYHCSEEVFIERNEVTYD
ncbi:Gp49 family protein [Vibrio sp. ER1A]|uniref:Gp49 family protein n=1 Tax=Vibrio sp. ER1A TaxID=1517681 RepID=UPI00057128E4|nr:Gp49 family protein [Vibrio sp. ER1A]